MLRNRKFDCTCAEDRFWGTHFQKLCNLYFCRNASKKSSNAWRNFSAELSKLLFTIPEEQCGCIFFLKKLSTHWFAGLRVKISAILPNFFGRFVIFLFLSMKSFLKVHSFYILISNFLGKFMIFRQVFAAMLSSMHSTCQNDTSGTIFPLEISWVLLFVWTLSWKITAFRQKVSAGLSKFHSTCPEDHY